MVTASARVGARSRSKMGAPPASVPVPRKSPRLYRSWAEVCASARSTAREGTASAAASARASRRETNFFMQDLLSMVGKRGETVENSMFLL